MTTTIQARYTDRSIEVEFDAGDVCLRTFEAGVRSVGMRVKPSDLLDAVRSELGAITIDKADLPEVTVEGNSTLVGVGHGPLRISASARRSTVSEMRRISLAYLALAEYLEAHPPVDPEAVAALHAEIEVSAASGRLGIAEHLVRVGYRKVAEQ